MAISTPLSLPYMKTCWTLTGWLIVNILTLNMTKTEFMLISSRQKLNNLPSLPSLKINHVLNKNSQNLYYAVIYLIPITLGILKPIIIEIVSATVGLFCGTIYSDIRGKIDVCCFMQQMTIRFLAFISSLPPVSVSTMRAPLIPGPVQTTLFSETGITFVTPLLTRSVLSTRKTHNSTNPNYLLLLPTPHQFWEVPHSNWYQCCCEYLSLLWTRQFKPSKR